MSELVELSRERGPGIIDDLSEAMVEAMVRSDARNPDRFKPPPGAPEGVVEFVCSPVRVSTLSDGGIRVVLDLQEDAIDVAAWIMAAKRVGVALKVSAEVA